MKRIIYFGAVALFIGITLTSLSYDVNSNPSTDSNKETAKRRISFKIRGTGSKGISVKIGVGSKVGTGSCCSTVSPFTTSGFSGEIGDVVYDSERDRVITKIYDGLEGQTIELKDYY
jgi:hypothetical protein